MPKGNRGFSHETDAQRIQRATAWHVVFASIIQFLRSPFGNAQELPNLMYISIIY